MERSISSRSLDVIERGFPLRDLLAGVSAAQVMSREVIFVEVDMPVDAAREVLSDYGVIRAPVVDAYGHPMGLVSIDDLQTTDDIVYTDRASPLQAVSESGLRFDLGHSFRLDATQPLVLDVMCPELSVVQEATSLAEIMDLMGADQTTFVAITDAAGQVSGVITLEDIVSQVRSWHRALRSLEQTLPRSIDVPVEPDDTPLSDFDEARETVLVVEDDEAVADGLVALLEDEGYLGLKAANGREALQLLSELDQPPGVILLDLMMPEMNGWEFRRAQLASEALRGIPVVVLTAYGRGVQPVDLSHPQAMLQKPVPADLLLETVASHYHPPN